MKAMIIIVAFFFTSIASAQNINSAVGARLAYGGLVSYQHKLTDEFMAEGILALRWGGIEITALAERYKPAFNNNNAHWFIGAGMHLGFHGRDNSFNPEKDVNSKTYINLGVDLIGGLAYNFPAIPINISIDYKPAFHFTGDRWFVGEGLGLSLRYML